MKRWIKNILLSIAVVTGLSVSSDAQLHDYYNPSPYIPPSDTRIQTIWVGHYKPSSVHAHDQMQRWDWTNAALFYLDTAQQNILTRIVALEAGGGGGGTTYYPGDGIRFQNDSIHLGSSISAIHDIDIGVKNGNYFEILGDGAEYFDFFLSHDEYYITLGAGNVGIEAAYSGASNDRLTLYADIGEIDFYQEAIKIKNGSLNFDIYEDSIDVNVSTGPGITMNATYVPNNYSLITKKYVDDSLEVIRGDMGSISPDSAWDVITLNQIATPTSTEGNLWYDNSGWILFDDGVAYDTLNLPSGGGGGSTYTFAQSVSESGSTVTLENDETSPGNDEVYSTGRSGTRGWNPIDSMLKYGSGVELSSDSIILGGASSVDIEIDMNPTTMFRVNSKGSATNFPSRLTVTNGEVTMAASGATSWGTGDYSSIWADGTGSYMFWFNGSAPDYIGVQSNINGVTIFDEANEKGAFYAGDYGDNFVARSLVDKQYVDAAIESADSSWQSINVDTIYSGANGYITHNILDLLQFSDLTSGTHTLYDLAYNISTNPVNSSVYNPGAGEDGYSITWDNGNSEYTLSEASGAQDSSWVSIQADTMYTGATSYITNTILDLLQFTDLTSGTHSLYDLAYNISTNPVNSTVYSPGSGQDGYAITWDNSSSEYTLSVPGGYWSQGTDNVYPARSGDNILPNGTASIGGSSVGRWWSGIYGNQLYVETTDNYLSATGTGDSLTLTDAYESLTLSEIARLTGGGGSGTTYYPGSGITISNDSIHWGGDTISTDARVVGLDNTIELESSLTAATRSAIVKVDASGSYLGASATIPFSLAGEYGRFYVTPFEVTQVWDEGSAVTKKITIDATAMTVIDNDNNKGLVYNADYSANYTNRSLVDKEYVDDEIAASGGGSGLSEGSGINVVGDSINIGGPMTSTATTTSLASGKSWDITTSWSTIAQAAKLSIANGNVNMYHSLGSTTLSSTDYGVIGGGSGAMSVYWVNNSGNDVKGLELTSSAATFYDEDNEKGLVYDADYSDNFTERSLPDVGYTNRELELFTFGAGSGASGDTDLFTTSALYGSFKNVQDTIVITKVYSVLQGSSPSVAIDLQFSQSLNGGTITHVWSTPPTVNNTGTGNANLSFTNEKIPPGYWVWLETSTVTTAPTYMSVTVIGYRKTW